MKLRMNNKGISLVELIICIAITSIVLTILAVYISGASRVFRKTNDDVNLQMEAQVTMNQLGNVLMEAKKYNPPDDPSAAQRKYIIEGFSDSNVTAIIFQKDKKKLYLVKTTSLADAQALNAVDYSDENYLLAEYLDEIMLTEVDTDTVIINLEFKTGDENYTVSRKIKLRNAE